MSRTFQIREWDVKNIEIKEWDVKNIEIREWYIKNIEIREWDIKKIEIREWDIKNIEIKVGEGGGGGISETLIYCKKGMEGVGIIGKGLLGTL